MHNSNLFRVSDRIIAFSAILGALLTFSVSAQEKKEDDKDDSDKKDKVKTIAEVLEDCDTLPGLFPLHQNRETGKLFLEVEEDQLSTGDGGGPEFIHFSHTLDGVTDLNLFRGQFSDERVFTIRRHFDRIEFVAENTSFYFNPDSALNRASEANVSDAILASEKIAAKDDAGRFLVDADKIFLKEFFRQLKPGKSKEDDKKDKFKLGDLSADRTRFLETKNFPDNTLVRVQYVFENLHPEKHGDEDVADSRFVTIKVQHTLIAMPDNDYEPRFADPRVGYFTTNVTDLTSKSSAPYRDFVNRWNLKKKNPEAKKSPPVEPITWWIENTTPVELRETIREGALAWNKAFESAGFIDAVEVKIQPDDADWDADDIRYHVLRWTSSPDPPFGGYGPSFVNPRTGQILGADIMLEYIFMTNRIRFNEIVDLGRNAEASGSGNSRACCQFGLHLHSNRVAAEAVMKTMGRGRFDNNGIEINELLRQALIDLVLHEIGHTIGLNHNFRASYLYDREQIQNKELTAKTGIIASVMDYAPINLALDPKKQGDFFSTVPGPYDHWAVRFGYDDADELDEILAESTKPENAFGNDADDMRSPGRGIDPRVMINDLTNEPIAYAGDQVTFVRQTLPKLIAEFPVDGESYHEVRTAFAALMKMHGQAAATISRFPGGVYIDRSTHGQAGAAEDPFVPVPEARQSFAMKSLDEYVFGPDAFEFPPELVARLQLERRGFEFFELDDNEDPKIHERVLSIQESTLDQLLHKNTLTRVIDTSLYGNDYTLAELMNDLDRSIMEGDPENGPTSFREALQIEYVERLITISGLKSDSKFPSAAKSQAILLLEQRLEPGAINPLPLRHSRHILRLISNALESR